MSEDNQSTQQQEVILAEEQSVVHKTGFMKETQGTLILTNKRLVFVAADQEIDFRATPIFTPGSMAHLRFSDVDDLKSIPEHPANVSIPLGEIELEAGVEHMYESPHLKIRYKDDGVEKKAEFVGDISGTGRKVDLKDWAKIIDSLKAGRATIAHPSSPLPSKNTLEGKVLYILGDVQDKGVLEIEQQTEEYFKLELEPEDVEAACKKLVSQGLVDAVASDGGDSFYRKRSPLGRGEDDLSS